MEDPMLEFG